MTSCKIKIQRFGEPGPLFADCADKAAVVATLGRFGVLQKGTEGGRASVAILADLPDGRVVVIETTAAIFDGLWHAMRGAMGSWGEAIK